MADLNGTRGKCRHCNGSLVFWTPDEVVERWGMMRRRIDKPRWYHLNPDPAAPNAANNIYQDTQWGTLGAFCPPKKNDEEGNYGQVGEPREFCVVMKTSDYGTPCMNPVVDEELFMCGIHAKKRREQMRRDELRRQRNEAAEALYAGRDEVVKRIYDNWGLKVEPSSGYGTWDGQVKMPHEDLEELLESLHDEWLLLQKRRKRATSRSQG